MCGEKLLHALLCLVAPSALLAYLPGDVAAGHAFVKCRRGLAEMLRLTGHSRADGESKDDQCNEQCEIDDSDGESAAAMRPDLNALNDRFQQVGEQDREQEGEQRLGCQPAVGLFCFLLLVCC